MNRHVTRGLLVLTIVAANLAGFAALAPPAAAASAPLATAATFSLPTVDVTNSPGTVVLTVVTANTGAAIQYGSVAVAGPNGGWQTAIVYPGQVVGTAVAAITVPQWSAAGTWSIDNLSLTDTLGVSTAWNSGTLPFLNPTLAVTDSNPDTAPPTASAAVLSPTTVDVSHGPQSVSVTVTAADDKSGLSSGTMDLSGPDGSSVNVWLSPSSATTMVGTATIPQWSAPQNWTIADLSLTDAMGNTAAWASANLPFTSPTLAVSDTTPDTAPPTASAATFSTDTVDVSATPQDVTVTVAASDDASGTTDGYVDLSGPDGSTVHANLSPGTTAGTMVGTAQIPQGATAGSWTIVDLGLTDAAGQSATWTAPGLPFGSPTLTVASTPADTTPPTVGTLTLSAPSTVPGATLTIDAAAADDLSGVAQVAVDVQDPTGATTWFASDPGPASGTSTDGHWSIPIALPADAAAGTWTIIEVNATDVAGNVTDTTLPTGPSFTVAAAPDAPTAVQAAPSGTSASVSWAAPADGGSAITAYAVRYSGDGGTTWSDPVPAGGSPATVPNLVPGSSYLFEARATNAAGDGPWSDPSPVVTLAGASPTPTPTQTPPTSTASSTLAVSSAATLTYGSPYTAATTLTSGGVAVAYAPVSLWLRPATSSIWMPATTALTSGNGTAVFTLKLKSGTWFQWRYAGDAAHAAAVSTARLIAVRPTVSLSFAPGTIRIGRVTRVFGVLTPATVGTKVHLEIWTGKAWRSTGLSASVRKQRLPNGKTATGYVITLKPTARGRLIYRVTTVATTSIAAAASPKGALTIR